MPALLALAVGLLVAAATEPGSLGSLLRSAAWLVGIWIAVSLAATAVAVRWFRARARANERIAPDGGEAPEAPLPGDPTTK